MRFRSVECIITHNPERIKRYLKFSHEQIYFSVLLGVFCLKAQVKYYEWSG